MSVPASFVEAFGAELDKRLATRTPRQQVIWLLKQRQVWSDIYAAFMENPEDGATAHPVFGAASAWDYALFLTEIEKRLSRAQVAA